jgi:hypothetical protein
VFARNRSEHDQLHSDLALDQALAGLIDDGTEALGGRWQ